MTNFDFKTLGDECVKCGKCIPVCTIHQVNADETTSPRGFLELLRAYKTGGLELDRNAKSIFESCFLCTNCVDVCPAKLSVDTAIENARADIAQKFGIAWYKRAFFLLLRSRWLMDAVMKMGFAVRSCAFEDDTERSSLKMRFRLPFVKFDRLLPSLKKTSFLNKYPANIDGIDGAPRVAVFIGCLANYNYTEVGDALIEVLKKCGVNIFIPKEQLCCGAPSYFTGDTDTTVYLAKKNIAYFETFLSDVDAIIIPEATCSSMIVHDWAKVLSNEPEWAERAKMVAAKVSLATKWLFEKTELLSLLEKNGKKSALVTYHDPCHARKTQGVWREPRALLSQNFKLIEMENPNRCCGFGGVTIQSEKFKLAEAAGRPKAEMIKATNADIVCAECSACRVQLSNALYQNDVKTVFRHPIELINEALSSAAFSG